MGVQGGCATGGVTCGCTDCHEADSVHVDGVAKTFSLRFPLVPDGVPKSAEEQQLDREAYNSGHRLREINSGLALAVPAQCR